MDENDALIDDQAALEHEYFSTVEHMRTITNNIAGVAAKVKHERDAFEQDLKGLQEQFNEQSEKLNEIQEKLASYTPRNVNKRQKRAHSKINNLKSRISELEVEKCSISNEFQKSRKNVNKPKVKANEIDLLKEHNAANILKLQSCAKELKEKKQRIRTAYLLAEG